MLYEDIMSPTFISIILEAISDAFCLDFAYSGLRYISIIGVDISFFASNISMSLGRPKVVFIIVRPATCFVLRVSCVLASPTLCAAITPTASFGVMSEYSYSFLSSSISAFSPYFFLKAFTYFSGISILNFKLPFVAGRHIQSVFPVFKLYDLIAQSHGQIIFNL